MLDAVQVFQEGGWSMWVVLGSTCLVLPMALAHAVFARAWSLLVALLGVALPCCAGGFGTTEGRFRVEQALEHVDPSQEGLLREVGQREASRPLTFGVCVAALGLPLLAIGEVRRLARSGAEGA